MEGRRSREVGREGIVVLEFGSRNSHLVRQTSDGPCQRLTVAFSQFQTNPKR